MLELTPDSHTDCFRLSAEFRQDESLTTSSKAGIYFGHKVAVAGPAGSADRAVVIEFPDDMKNNEPNIPEQQPVNGQWGDPLTLTDMLVTRTADIPFQLDGPALEIYWVKETKPKDETQRPWRKIVAEVTPDTIQVYWRNPAGSMQPIRPVAIPTKELHQIMATSHAERLANIYPRPGIERTGLGYTPRGGVGLYVRDVRVFFKNVVLEPIAP
jgi:hypothetical protein